MRKSDWQLVILGSILVVGVAIYVYPIRIPKQDYPISSSSSSSCSEEKEEEEETSPPTSLRFPNYGSFYFVQTWPPTFCMKKSDCRRRLPNRGGFTIHGLWPQSRPGGDRLLWYCCDTEDHPDCRFNCTKATNNEKIREDLNWAWPNLKKRQKNSEFWRHEWEKHGTCSLHRLTQTDYFLNSLRLYHMSNLTSAISGLKNKTIPIRDIKAAVRNKTGYTALLKCRSNKYLEEIILCADVNATRFIDWQRK